MGIFLSNPPLTGVARLEILLSYATLFAVASNQFYSVSDHWDCAILCTDNPKGPWEVYYSRRDENNTISKQYHELKNLTLGSIFFSYIWDLFGATF